MILIAFYFQKFFKCILLKIRGGGQCNDIFMTGKIKLIGLVDGTIVIQSPVFEIGLVDRLDHCVKPIIYVRSICSGCGIFHIKAD